MRLLRLTLVLAVIAAPEVALAVEAADEHAANPWLTIVWNVINFVLLISIVAFALKKFGIKGYLAERRTDIENDIKDADDRKASAEKRHQEYTERLANIEQEVAALRQEFVDAAEKENERTLEEAKASAERLKKNAEFIAEQEVKKGRAMLQREAALLAIETAEKIVKEQLTDDDRHRLVTEFLDEVRRSAGGRPQ